MSNLDPDMIFGIVIMHGAALGTDGADVAHDWYSRSLQV